MSSDGLVDAFTAFEAGPHETPGIASIQRGARGTAQLVPRPTRFEDHVVGEVVAREDDLALVTEHVATQTNGMGAPATLCALGQEVVEAVPVRMPTERMEVELFGQAFTEEADVRARGCARWRRWLSGE